MKSGEVHVHIYCYRSEVLIVNHNHYVDSTCKNKCFRAKAELGRVCSPNTCINWVDISQQPFQILRNSDKM